MSLQDMNPQEIDAALRAPQTTFEVTGDMVTAILRPASSSRSYVLVARIQTLEEI